MTDLYSSDKRNRVVRRNIPLTAFLMFLHSTGEKKVIIIIITCQLSSAVIASCLAGELDTSDEVASTRSKFLIPTARKFAISTARCHFLARSSCSAWEWGVGRNEKSLLAQFIGRFLLLRSLPPAHYSKGKQYRHFRSLRSYNFSKCRVRVGNYFPLTIQTEEINTWSS